MKLINVSDDFSVESFKFGNMNFEFVHNNKTMENYFNQKVLSKLFDIKQSNLSIHLNKYLKLIEEDNSFIDNINKACILFKTNETSQKVKFYDFNAVTYLAFKINTSNAVCVRNFISQTLNTMFNVATGQLDIDTKLEKLRNMQEVEEFKSKEYLNAWKTLKAIDEGMANQAMHNHIVHRENAYNCLELLRTKNDWNDRFDVVNKQINGKIDNTKQLTFLGGDNYEIVD